MRQFHGAFVLWQEKKDISAFLQEVREMKSLTFVQQPCQSSDLVTSLHPL